MDKFTAYCRNGWEDDPTRFSDFIIRTADRVGIILENVEFSNQHHIATAEVWPRFSKGGEMLVSANRTAVPEEIYGAAMVAVSEAALSASKELPIFPITAKLNDVYDKHRDFIKMGNAKHDRDYAVKVQSALQHIAGLKAMEEVLPGASEAMRLGVSALMMSQTGRAMKSLNPTVIFDQTLSALTELTLAGDEGLEGDAAEASELLWDCTDFPRLLDLIFSLAKQEEHEDSLGQEPDKPDMNLAAALTQAMVEAMVDGIGGKSGGVSTDRWTSEKGNVTDKITGSSLATEVFRAVMMEDRIERESGHFTGLVNQPTRIFSDFRVMSRRMVQEETPDSLFVSLTDSSGSMNWGGRWTRACEIHDGVMKAFHELGIPAISAAFDQGGGGHDRIFPICKQGDEPVKLSSGARPIGGTGDLGAINWATRQLNKAGKKGRVVLVVSDSEGPTEPVAMKRALKLLNANVVHVDVSGTGVASYGVEPISLTKEPDIEFYRDLASRLRAALELQGEVTA